MELRRASMAFGEIVRDARLARRLTVGALAARAGISPGLVYRVESGGGCSKDAAARIAVALGQRLDIRLRDPRKRELAGPDLARDVVHSAMGELEARHLRSRGFAVGIDEPYQHYQFAGRADVVAWDVARRSLLHIENRTRFPDFQEMAGAYNAKRAYLGVALAGRVGVPAWASQCHVMAALWSSEVLRAVRHRSESFRSLCPDDLGAVRAWWAGDPPAAGTTSTLIILDPLAAGRERRFIGLDAVTTARPRHVGYAAVANTLRRAA